MERDSTNQDLLGAKFGVDYVPLLTDITLEKRLHAYDPNLKLMFDQRTKKWKLLCWREDNSGWQILMSLEDDVGNPIFPGDWIFLKLNEMRRRWEEKARNFGTYYNRIVSEQEDYREKVLRKQREEAQYQIRHDKNLWRRAMGELTNTPGCDTSGVTQRRYNSRKK